MIVREARRGEMGVVELTTNAQRAGAHRFHERLGSVGSHIEMKYYLGGERG